MSKWSEREFWAALLPFILGILTTTGVIGPDDGSQIGGVILMVGPTLGYIVMRVVQKIKATEAAALVKVEEAKADAKAIEASANLKIEQTKANAEVKIAQAVAPTSAP